jgi:hypothetical protein
VTAAMEARGLDVKDYSATGKIGPYGGDLKLAFPAEIVSLGKCKICNKKLIHSSNKPFFVFSLFALQIGPRKRRKLLFQFLTELFFCVLPRVLLPV